MQNKESLLNALHQWINRRPGLEPDDYGCHTPEGRNAYRADARKITKDLHHARQLLAYVSRRDSITADAIIEATRGTRLEIKQTAQGYEIEHTTGQYFPVEYRAAVARVCASAIWDRMREDRHPDSKLTIHQTARRELGKTLANRFFN